MRRDTLDQVLRVVVHDVAAQQPSRGLNHPPVRGFMRAAVCCVRAGAGTGVCACACACASTHKTPKGGCLQPTMLGGVQGVQEGRGGRAGCASACLACRRLVVWKVTKLVFEFVNTGRGP